MKFLNSGNVMRLALDQIAVGKRLRAVTDSQVENLLLMAEDTGITTPIHCRRVAGRYELIDGAHRLEATRRLGLPDIAALIVECRQNEARSMEASNNLGAARMSPLQTAVFAASWKRDYYAAHPERKPGLFKGNRHTGKLVGDTMSLTNSVADAFGITERHAHRILAVGEQLDPDEVALLDASGHRVALADLAVLSKIGEPEERADVVRALAGGKVKAAAARRVWKAQQNGVSTLVKTPVEAGFNALASVWNRVPLAAKKRFCLHYAHDIWEVQNKGAALNKAAEASDE